MATTTPHLGLYPSRPLRDPGQSLPLPPSLLTHTRAQASQPCPRHPAAPHSPGCHGHTCLPHLHTGHCAFGLRLHTTYSQKCPGATTSFPGTPASRPQLLRPVLFDSPPLAGQAPGLTRPASTGNPPATSESGVATWPRPHCSSPDFPDPIHSSHSSRPSLLPHPTDHPAFLAQVLQLYLQVIPFPHHSSLDHCHGTLTRPLPPAPLPRCPAMPS